MCRLFLLSICWSVFIIQLVVKTLQWLKRNRRLPHRVGVVARSVAHILCEIWNISRTFWLYSLRRQYSLKTYSFYLLSVYVNVLSGKYAYFSNGSTVRVDTSLHTLKSCIIHSHTRVEINPTQTVNSFESDSYSLASVILSRMAVLLA